MNSSEKGRCRLNERGRRVYARSLIDERAGTIVRETANKAFWMILWDGYKYPQQYDKRFIELIEVETVIKKGECQC